MSQPVFDLPEEILATLTLKSNTPSISPRLIADVPSPRSRKDEEKADDGTPTAATSCNLCCLSFPSLQDQRSHVRSDLHGYNLKQKLKGLPPVAEADFEHLIGGEYELELPKRCETICGRALNMHRLE